MDPPQKQYEICHNPQFPPYFPTLKCERKKAWKVLIGLAETIVQYKKSFYLLGKKFRVSRIVSRRSRLTMSIEAAASATDSFSQRGGKEANMQMEQTIFGKLWDFFFPSFFAVFRWAKSSFDGFDSQTQIYGYSLYIFLKILLQQVLLPSSSQTLDIRENRKWQKVWASLRSHLCTKSSSTDVVHKTKTEKRGREITNYFTHKSLKNLAQKIPYGLFHLETHRYFMFLSDLVCPPLLSFLVGKNPIQAFCPFTNPFFFLQFWDTVNKILTKDFFEEKSFILWKSFKIVQNRRWVFINAI